METVCEKKLEVGKTLATSAAACNIPEKESFREHDEFSEDREFLVLVCCGFLPSEEAKILSIFVLKSRKKYKSQKRNNTLNESASLL